MMLHRFLTLTAKDLRLIVRNHMLTVVVAVALIIVGTVNFLVPEDVSSETVVVLWDRTTAQSVGRLFEAADAETIFVDSEAAFEEAMAVYGNRLGLRVEGGEVPERVVVTYQGHENPEVRRLLEASLRQQLRPLRGEAPLTFATETLQPGTAPERPPFNLSLLPILIFTEAGMIGLLLAAALFYSEKTEGTLQAYRVTPGGLTEYLLAKSVAMGLVGLVSTTIITLLTVGLDVNWPAVLGVVFLSAVVVTLVTLVAANMFQTISQFLFTGVLLNLVLALPTVSYFLPGFAPVWLRWLPSYPMIFALREAYFPTGAEAVLTGAVGQILLTLVVVLPLAVLAFRRQLIARDV